MKTPHKHAETIKAWADGAEIECRDAESNWQPTGIPGWFDDVQYRVKPLPMISSKADELIDKLLELQRDRYMICCDSPKSASAMFEAREELEAYIFGLETKP